MADSSARMAGITWVASPSPRKSAAVRVRERWKASQLGRRLPESQIGPRTTMLDRARHARLRARQLRRPEPAPTAADFLGDEQETQVIPVVRHEDGRRELVGCPGSSSRHR